MEKLKEEKIVHFVRKLLNIYDFDLVVDFNRNLEKVFRLKDLQNGNIREKDNKEFYTLADIINITVIIFIHLWKKRKKPIKTIGK